MYQRGRPSLQQPEMADSRDWPASYRQSAVVKPVIAIFVGAEGEQPTRYVTSSM